MGVGAIPQAMSLPQSRAMVPALDRQLREYRAIAAQSQAYARAHGRRELRGPGTAALAMSAAMLRAQSMLDPSTSRLAERMIQGSTCLLYTSPSPRD